VVIKSLDETTYHGMLAIWNLSELYLDSDKSLNLVTSSASNRAIAASSYNMYVQGVAAEIISWPYNQVLPLEHASNHSFQYFATANN
jgi:hypothetical protein